MLIKLRILIAKQLDRCTHRFAYVNLSLQPLPQWCDFHWSHSPSQCTATEQVTGRTKVGGKHILHDSLWFRLLQNYALQCLLKE